MPLLPVGERTEQSRIRDSLRQLPIECGVMRKERSVGCALRQPQRSVMSAGECERSHDAHKDCSGRFLFTTRERLVGAMGVPTTGVWWAHMLRDEVGVPAMMRAARFCYEACFVFLLRQLSQIWLQSKRRTLLVNSCSANDRRRWHDPANEALLHTRRQEKFFGKLKYCFSGAACLFANWSLSCEYVK